MISCNSDVSLRFAVSLKKCLKKIELNSSISIVKGNRRTEHPPDPVLHGGFVNSAVSYVHKNDQEIYVCERAHCQ